MNLILDIGNSCCKISVFENNTLIDKQIVKSSKEEIISSVNKINKVYRVDNAIFSCVGLIEKEIEDFLKNIFPNILFFSSFTKSPIKNKYLTPEKLGIDRLAAACGAFFLFPNKDCLIIDAGTAVTFDYLNCFGEFLGGNISPGIRLRFASLYEHTAKLPLIETFDWYDGFGNDTHSAILSGVLTGLKHEIEGYISDFEALKPDSKIILTGGDTFFLAKKLKNTIFAEPNLVSIGLNGILNYNVSKKDF